MAYINNNGFFDQLEVDRIIRQHGESDRTYSYRLQRQLFLKRAAGTRARLRELEQDHFFNRLFSRGERRELHEEIEQHQQHMVGIRAKYYDPEHRLARAVKGLS